jgi:hypothetical protein
VNANRSAAGFSLARVHPLEWAVGLSGVALIVGLLLPWSGGSSALDSPGFLDVVLALFAVTAVLLPVVTASSPRTNVPIVYETFLWTISLLLVIVLVIKAVFPPDGGFGSGFWLVLAATLVTSLSAWRSVGRER